MDNQKAYDAWASSYDTDENKTRDLEADAFRKILGKLSFNDCLEIGCGTGKNTVWLHEKARAITAVDFSSQMIGKAREKIKSGKINFITADINKEWNFGSGKFDMITFSLVLEHIENLDHVFSNACRHLNPGGYIYIGELHPYKQYDGSKARFQTESGIHILDCYIHNISDFLIPAFSNKLQLVELIELFDTGDGKSIPRILSILFRRQN